MEFLLGFMGGLERATHIDFNGDNIIGRRPDIMPGYQSGYGYGGYPGYNAYGYSYAPGAYRY